jgi:DNA mismatch endonuclease (patch repair protein)
MVMTTPDHLNAKARSTLMRSVRRTGTSAELSVCETVRRLGYRFRVDQACLPGRPDLVFPRLKAVIFVHGCFWHRHEGCRRASVPSTRTEYWLAKFERNVARDATARRHLRKLGWRVLTLWGCELNKGDAIAARVKRFLQSAHTVAENKEVESRRVRGRTRGPRPASRSRPR